MEQDSKGQAKGALMKSLDNALTLLEQFTPEAPAFGITELATRLGLNKATVFNMLKTLEAHSLVEQLSDTKKYTLGHGIIVLAGTKLAQSELSHVARPHLARLSHETNETTHLAILHRNELLYLEKIESSQPVRVAARIGGRAPLHCTANGKVLLAFQPNEVIEEALRAPRARYTENTIVDPAVLRSQLAEIRQAGYCIEWEEFIADIRGIAAPVFDFNGTVIAAIAVVGPSARITEGQIEALVPLTLRTAESISRSLGHKPYKDA